MKILEQQQAKRGVQSSATAVIEIEDIKEAIKGIEGGLRRRLQSLLEKQAILGLSADPSIGIEIEDIQEYFEDEDKSERKII